MYQRTVQRWTLPARLASPKISRWSCRATVYIFLAASFDANNAGSAWCLSDWYDRQPSACYGRNRLFIISAYRYRSLFHKCSRGDPHADIWYIDRRAPRSLRRGRVFERRILYGGRLRSLEARFADDRRSRLGVGLPMIILVRKFWADETGATAIEYGLIAAGIALAIIAVVNGLGTKLNTKFTSINSSLK
jgi:pilus assembly protein Flp/PilA